MYIIHGINKQNATGFTRLKFLYFEILKFIAMISYSFSAQKLMRTLFKNYLLVLQLNGKQTNRLLLQSKFYIYANMNSAVFAHYIRMFSVKFVSATLSNGINKEIIFSISVFLFQVTKMQYTNNLSG